jgi:predicted RNA-binding Zn-ribbon protein involved in translation (DUF1610 family)
MPFIPVDEDNQWFNKKECKSREHFPPTMIVFPDGKPRIWVCPSCGHHTLVQQPFATCKHDNVYKCDNSDDYKCFHNASALSC